MIMIVEYDDLSLSPRLGCLSRMECDYLSISIRCLGPNHSQHLSVWHRVQVLSASSRLPVLIIRVYNSGLEGVLGSGGFDAEEIHGGVSSG